MKPPPDEYEVVWNGATVNRWGEKGGLLCPIGYRGGSTWQLVEEALQRRVADGRQDLEGGRASDGEAVRDDADSGGWRYGSSTEKRARLRDAAYRSAEQAGVLSPELLEELVAWDW